MTKENEWKGWEGMERGGKVRGKRGGEEMSES